MASNITPEWSASHHIVQEFFEGTGVEVYDYLPDGHLTLVAKEMGGSTEYELNFQVQDGLLLVWRERHAREEVSGV